MRRPAPWEEQPDRAGPHVRHLQAGSSAPERPGRRGRREGLPHLSLADALDLTMLVARKDPQRHPRVAARWLLRLLEEDPDMTIAEAALATSALAALPGAGYLEAVQRPISREEHRAEIV